MNVDDDYFSSIGNLYSGSQDPDDYAPYLEKEAEKRRREQEREQARLLREQQQAQQSELQKSLQQTAPKPIVLEDKEPKPLPNPTPTIRLMAYRMRNGQTSCFASTITTIAIRTIIRVNDSHRIKVNSISTGGKKKSGDIPTGSGISFCN